MDLQRFFNHWNLREHPFQAEEALNDAVYNRMLKDAISHPDFTKIYGDPANPGTTIVFGEKGSGKTAIRLMIQRKLNDYNMDRDSGQVFVVSYEELNPMLDRLARYMKTIAGEKIMKSIRLADHQDAILSLAVTKLLDEALEADDKATSKDMARILKKMDLQRRLNLAALALLYDNPKHAQASDRWHRLMRTLKMKTAWDRSRHGLFFVFAAVVGVVGGLGWSFLPTPGLEWVTATVVGIGGAVLLGGWWLMREWRNSKRGRQLAREIRAVAREKGEAARHLWNFRKVDDAVTLFPAKIDQDSRYELTGRFLDVIRDFGYSSIIVLMDRVDEPVLVNGDAKRMKMLVWPMLNNKFLQQENVGIKMLLPIELSHMLASEDLEFKRQARLDKQNVINPLKWTGTTLYDLCSWRFKNCQTSEEHISLDAMFDDDVQSAYLIESLDQMHQPRDAFKFLYAVILEHCRNTPGDSEDYQISRSTLDFVRRQQSERVVDLYRGVATS